MQELSGIWSFNRLKNLFFTARTTAPQIIQSVFDFFIKAAMAIAVKILVGDLIAELFAHALVFGRFFHSAGAIPPARLKSVLNKFYNLFIFVQNYFHNITFCRNLLRQTVLPLLTQQSAWLNAVNLLFAYHVARAAFEKARKVIERDFGDIVERFHR